MQRICIVTPNHPNAAMGGAEYQIECLINVLLQGRRHEIYYLAHHVRDEVQPPDHRIVRVGSGQQVGRFGYWLDAVPLYRALSRIRPEVIYQRVACGYTGIAAHYARTRGARVVWHVAHDSDVMPENNIDKRHYLSHALEKSCIHYGIRHASRIIVQTEHQAKLLARNFQRAADAVIPNFHPEPREAIDKSAPLSVVWVANLRPWKRPEVFVRLAAALSDLQDVRFIMVGAVSGGSPQWRKELLASIAQVPHLDYRGVLKLSEVNALLARSHVFVNTSVEEGYPNTFIQSWMRRVPVVSLSVNPDGVLDDRGVGIHAGTEQRLERAVRSLLTDQRLREEYGERAFRHAMQHHSLANAVTLAQLMDTGGTGQGMSQGTGQGTNKGSRPDQSSRALRYSE